MLYEWCSAHLFCSNLCSSSSLEGSMLFLGGTDYNYYSGSLNWIPLYGATNYWNIQIQR